MKTGTAQGTKEKRRKLSLALVAGIMGAALALVLFLAACTGSQSPPSPAGTTAPRGLTSEPGPGVKAGEEEATKLALGGEAIYAKSCAACHGANAEGTTIAPMIAGHRAAPLKLQVRNPMGKMPAFPPAQLGDGDLDKVAAFVLGLGPAAMPVMDWEKAAPETMHHWMALLAIKADDPADAKHHLQDALTFVKEPMLKTEMAKAIDLIDKANFHDAEHEIEEMAGAEAPSGVGMQRLHLTLAMQAVEAKDATRAKHHVDHFAVKATDAQKAIVKEAQELLAKNDFHEAEHEIEELLKE